MSRRTIYSDERKYKHNQLRFLTTMIEENLKEMIFDYKEHPIIFKKLKNIQEMFEEIQLRLD